MSFRSLARVLTCGFAFAGMAGAQRALPEAKFAVEIPGVGGPLPLYVPLHGGGATSLFHDGSLRRKAGGDANRRQPTALQLEYRVEGAVVRIAAYVYYDEFDRQMTPVSLYGLPKQKVGERSAGLNETVILTELEQVGLEALTLKILLPQPETSSRPQVRSNAPSLQIEIVGEDRVFYTVLLRNLSAKAVTAYHVSMKGETGGGGQSAVGDRSRPAVAPGGTRQLRIGISRSGRMSEGRFVENPPPPFMVLEAALFDDGSYEGDIQVVAEMIAQQMGHEIQRQRINRLVEAILADDTSGEDAKIARIRSEVAQLSEDPEPGMVERIRSQFPALSGEALEPAKRGLGLGLNDEKQSLDFALKEFQRGRAGPRGQTLAQWWSWRQK